MHFERAPGGRGRARRRGARRHVSLILQAYLLEGPEKHDMVLPILSQLLREMRPHAARAAASGPIIDMETRSGGAVYRDPTFPEYIDTTFPVLGPLGSASSFHHRDLSASPPDAPSRV